MMNENKYGQLCWTVDAEEDYTEFRSRKEAQDWGKINYEGWANRYKKAMSTSQSVIKSGLSTIPVESYCGYSYRQINQFLRNGDDNECNTYRELAVILSIALCSAPRIPQNIVLYRMVNDEFVNMLIEKNKQDCPTPIQEKGFMSTSLLKDISNESEPYAANNNLLKIFVPKDTIGIYVNAITRRSEEEMLLLPNMYLGLASYPYKDEKNRKMIFECRLIHFNI